MAHCVKTIQPSPHTHTPNVDQSPPPPSPHTHTQTLFIFIGHYRAGAGGKKLTNMAKKPNFGFLCKRLEKSSHGSNSRAGDLPCSFFFFFNGMCVFHKYLICEIAADICLWARGGNMQSNCEILINLQTNMWEWDPADVTDWLCLLWLHGKIKHKCQIF